MTSFGNNSVLNVLFLSCNFAIFQKIFIKPLSLEEAVRVIQIAERARQGRLRATFMKQIYIEEKREKLSHGKKGPDLEAAAVYIQKVTHTHFHQNTMMLLQNTKVTMKTHKV